jgi:hypothetical protein
VQRRDGALAGQPQAGHLPPRGSARRLSLARPHQPVRGRAAVPWEQSARGEVPHLAHDQAF